MAVNISGVGSPRVSHPPKLCAKVAAARRIVSRGPTACTAKPRCKVCRTVRSVAVLTCLIGMAYLQ
eukprot:7493064-Pyramimonas_sp.AAC.1